MPGVVVSAAHRQTLLPSTSPYCWSHCCDSLRSPLLGLLQKGALFVRYARDSSTTVSRVSNARFSATRVNGTSFSDAKVGSARGSGQRVYKAEVSSARLSSARVSGAAFSRCGVRRRGGVVSATRRSVALKDPIEISSESLSESRNEGAELENGLGVAHSQGERETSGQKASASGQGITPDTDVLTGIDSEAPKRRRRTPAVGDEGRVKRAYTRRKKVIGGLEIENGVAASNGRSESGDPGLGAASVNGFRGDDNTVNAASTSGRSGGASGIDEEKLSVNGVASSKDGANGPRKRRGRKKAAPEKGSEAGLMAADGETVELEADGELEGVGAGTAHEGGVNAQGSVNAEGSVNGRKATVRRKRKVVDSENENGRAVGDIGALSTSDTDSDGADLSDAHDSGIQGQKRPVGSRRKTKGMELERESEADSDDLGLRRGSVESDDSDGDGSGVSGNSVSGTGVSGTRMSGSTDDSESVNGSSLNGRSKPVRQKRRSKTTDTAREAENGVPARTTKVKKGASREGLSGERPAVASEDSSAGSQKGFSEAFARSAQNGYPVRDFNSEDSSDESLDSGVLDGGLLNGGFLDDGFSDDGFSDGSVSDGAISNGGESEDGVSSGRVSDDGVSDSASDVPSPSGRKTVTGRRKSTAKGPRSKARHKTPDPEVESEPLETVTGYPLPAPPVFEPAPRRILDAPTVPAKKPPKARGKTGRATVGSVKEKLSQGLAMVSGNGGTDGEIDNSIDPHRLVRGELVVHKKVGIGRFRELRNETVDGRAAPVQFVYLEYADGLAKLPAHQAHRLLYRYRSPGVEGKEPALSKLKDRRAWERRKSKGRAHIQKMVINILKLYRLRAAVTRPPYPPDGEGQSRFEATFTYQPTEHQQQAFDAVRDDMCNKTVPMDRIVCGDVGFGKTEVALRAIFRAANAGRQVAVLAPTTVLAKQHYDVVVDRFKAFPEIEITMLSRLAGEKEKKIGLERMSKGLVHVAVGTHALLGENVQFKDLGLLVVDEEQRFGVRQKERMKDMKTEIDVLTLSATPIPRTLEQATRGLKDLSLITTPPPSRRPIKTHLQQYDDKLVEWAIERELERGGQVFYIVPRIYGGKNTNSRSISEVKDYLKEKMPHVTVDMAHGQMSGPELERSMRAFRDGKVQILLCTSIVESGLDIPNCNTIIITEVEKFGLAQIYQLRGRVGRSSIEAHAYLLYSVENREELNPAAELRLQALEECVDLGAGVHVAQRDLTIRGTGEVFGEKQSGKLSSEIGADLFNEMLFDSLYRAQTESLPKVDYDDVKVDFVVDTLVPHDYIDCTEGRDQFLEDMEKAARGGVDSANEFYLEMEERLGPPPPGAKRRLQMLVMKQLAAALGITRIRTRPKFVLFETSMSIGAFQMLFDAIDEERAVDIKNNLIYKEGSAGFLLKSLLGLPPEKEAQDAFECLLEMSKGLDSFMNLERSSES